MKVSLLLFKLNNQLGTLEIYLGCCPFDLWSFAPTLSLQLLFCGIQSLFSISNPCGPQPKKELYPHEKIHCHAILTYISTRTSYLQIRLAFHCFWQVIRSSCNTNRLSPPLIYSISFDLLTKRSSAFGWSVTENVCSKNLVTIQCHLLVSPFFNRYMVFLQNKNSTYVN